MLRPLAFRSVVWLLVVTGLLLVTGATATVYLRHHSKKAPAPLEVSLWYWHRPFRIPPTEIETLHAMGVRQLFVNAGTITRDATGSLTATLPQTWASTAPNAPTIQLVFRVDDAVSYHLREIPAQQWTNTLLVAIRSQRRLAAQAGLRIIGVQIDMDAPTRLLPDYTARLLSLRQALVTTDGQPPLQLSITLLSSWYASRDIDTLLDAVDFAAPQFYEEVTPRTRREFVPISNDRALERGLRAAERSGRPFYAGLPAYGHALVYDGSGNLRGLFHDAQAPAILRSPDFRLVGDFSTGEQILEFAGAHADGGDFRLLFDLPTPGEVAREWNAVRNNRPPNCRGVILYRYPAPGDVDALPLTTLAALVKGEAPAAPRLQVTVRKHNNKPNGELFVDVTAQGPFGTRVGPDAATVTVRFDRASRVLEASPGDFDAVIPLNAGSRCSVARADSLRFTAGYLAPGQTVTAGPIRLTSTAATAVGADWSSSAAETGITAQGTGSLTLTARKTKK